jgi:kanamycin nucleotidyltransferase
VEGLRPHTRADRAGLVAQLIELHRRQLGDNLLGLASQGSYARGRDGDYSDIELVAFLAEVPGGTNWADCVQIWQGILIDIIWTTKDEYVARVKEITPSWHLAGSDHLGALINEPLIEEINGHEVRDRRARCLAEAARHWPVTQEATGKVLNAVRRGNTANVGRLLFAMLDEVLIELAFINERPYDSASTALDEAASLRKLPRGFAELAALAVAGGYTDLDRVRRVAETVFAGMEELFAAEGVGLYQAELVLRPVPAA